MGAALAFACGVTTNVAAVAAAQPRVASINMCTDQLLIPLADPEQIVGLSPYARDPVRSWAFAEAARYRLLSGEAEDVLMLKPDLVVAERFTKQATRELLKQKGLRVAEFDVARSLDDAKGDIVRMGSLIRHPDRAAALAAQLDAAVGRARAAASHNNFHVLPVSRRGWISGADSLIISLLAAAGLSNPAGSLSRHSSGYVSMESIIATKPDLLLVSEESGFAEDQGGAFLLHPALERLYPPAKRIVVPERLTICGGPMLAEALDRLTAELERVSR